MVRVLVGVSAIPPSHEIAVAPLSSGQTHAPGVMGILLEKKRQGSSTPKSSHGPTIGNPGPLGLSAFAVTTLLLSLVNAKVVGYTHPNIVLGMAFFYGGAVQIIAGIFEMIIGNTVSMRLASGSARMASGCLALATGAVWSYRVRELRGLLDVVRLPRHADDERARRLLTVSRCRRAALSALPPFSHVPSLTAVDTTLTTSSGSFLQSGPSSPG